jgi:DNA-binding transcriptional MerR regulator
MTTTAPVEVGRLRSISEAAALTGVSTHTLRYYERAGLMLDPVPRATSSHRRYTDDDIRWVEFLTKLRSTGMPIRQVRLYTDMTRSGPDTEADRLALLERHRRSVLAQLDDIRNNLAAIDKKIAMYRERTPRP